MTYKPSTGQSYSADGDIDIKKDPEWLGWPRFLIFLLTEVCYVFKSLITKVNQYVTSKGSVKRFWKVECYFENLLSFQVYLHYYIFYFGILYGVEVHVNQNTINYHHKDVIRVYFSRKKNRYVLGQKEFSINLLYSSIFKIAFSYWIIFIKRNWSAIIFLTCDWIQIWLRLAKGDPCRDPPNAELDQVHVRRFPHLHNRKWNFG